MLVALSTREFALAFYDRTAFYAAILDHLVGLVAPAFIVVMNVGAKTKLAHRLAPSRPVPAASPAVPRHGKEVRVFVLDRILDLFKGVEKVGAKQNPAFKFRGHACRSAKVPPLEFRLIAEWEAGG